MDVENLVAKASDNLSVRRAFGTAYEKDGMLITGAYVVKGDQVRWVPAVDVTIVVLASLGLVRILTRAWRRRRA
jgi:hypothetical protein